ncbi:pantothenate synthetase [Fluviicoccus keumensis]|uniref:Pantothenate synthetase n=1 Tax=Fluviicoccus keumensis TaxID=1435465 RepID=A0A4Q7Z947_9GAMM|nr:pantoate--beta-alanine ligase [Fluviicoccus keumensis]RZU47057.1 pantothenate synthetase [Fluviicoccus keumensis]
MRTEHTIQGLREQLRQARRDGKTIGFVPTMGNLHAGHISLVERAKVQCDIVVASIFVNPTQFGANEDFGTYPRTLEADSQLLSAAQCDFLFAPAASEMYANDLNQSTIVHVAELGKELCGAHRPGHFDGVSSVVSKLFNIVQPDTAFFGEKDFQQLAIIRRMTHELNFPITIVGVPTARAEDGLALSSRNGYLSDSERKQAPMLYRMLCQLRDAISYGQRDYAMLTDAACLHLQKSGFEPDYVSVRRASDLLPATAEDTALVILVAARLGKTRLIDNLAFDLPAGA